MWTLIWIAIIFFIISLFAYAFGARGVAGASAGMSRTLLFVALVLAVISAIAWALGGAHWGPGAY